MVLSAIHQHRIDIQLRIQALCGGQASWQASGDYPTHANSCDPLVRARFQDLIMVVRDKFRHAHLYQLEAGDESCDMGISSGSRKRGLDYRDKQNYDTIS